MKKRYLSLFLFGVLVTAVVRAASVTFEREENEDDAIVLLREGKYDADARTVTVKSDLRVYELDVRKIDSDELGEMRRVLRKMNFDSSFKLEGI